MEQKKTSNNRRSENELSGKKREPNKLFENNLSGAGGTINKLPKNNLSDQKAAAAISVFQQIEYPEQNFYNVPASPASNLIMETLGAGVDIADLPSRKKQINHNTRYEILKDQNKRLVSLKNSKGTAEVIIELSDIDKMTGSNKPTKKLFILSLIKLNEQAIHNMQLTKDHIAYCLPTARARGHRILKDFRKCKNRLSSRNRHPDKP